jgi:hypothetical protein
MPQPQKQCRNLKNNAATSSGILIIGIDAWLATKKL